MSEFFEEYDEILENEILQQDISELELTYIQQLQEEEAILNSVLLLSIQEEKQSQSQPQQSQSKQSQSKQSQEKDKQSNNSIQNQQQSQLTCPICITAIQLEDIFNLEHENHIVCRDCGKGYIESKLQEHKIVISCMFPNCKCLIHENKLFEVLDEKYQILYYQLGVSPQTDPQFRQCPVPNCQGFCLVEMDSSDCICYQCHNHWCCSCEVNLDTTEHKDLTCERYQQLKRTSQNKDTTDNVTKEILLQGLKDDSGNRIRLCPNCKHPYSKDENCNHVVCEAGCGAHFCFHCAEFFSFNARDVYNHFDNCAMYGNNEDEDDYDEF